MQDLGLDRLRDYLLRQGKRCNWKLGRSFIGRGDCGCGSDGDLLLSMYLAWEPAGTYVQPKRVL